MSECFAFPVQSASCLTAIGPPECTLDICNRSLVYEGDVWLSIIRIHGLYASYKKKGKHDKITHMYTSLK